MLFGGLLTPFSATLPKALVEFARAGLNEPKLIRLDTDTKVSENLRLAFFVTRKEEKAAALLALLKHVIPSGQPTIIFASTRHHVEFLVQLLIKSGLKAVHIYGSMDSLHRKNNLYIFKSPTELKLMGKNNASNFWKQNKIEKNEMKVVIPTMYCRDRF